MFFCAQNWVRIGSNLKLKTYDKYCHKITFKSMTTMNSSVKRSLISDETDVDSNNESNQNNPQIRPKKRMKPFIPEYRLDDSDYYIENGLRKVYPYYYTYYAHCKGRWVGCNLYELFCKEFRAISLQKIQNNIEEGLLLVNNEKVDVNYQLRDHDVITHRLHRHEMPVLAAPIPIIHMSDDILVIDKPPSIPVHSCGRYRHNSILCILEREQQIKDLHTIHRLDRLTSGVVLFARTIQMAQKIHEQIRNRVVAKEYVCRVEGQFPDGIVNCEQPIEVLSYKIGICIVSPNGKSCSTSFERLNYNGKTSTVLCKPITGRMHQIRVHLQYLGYPIVNDTFYNNFVFGPQKGKNAEYGKDRETLLRDMEEQHSKTKWICDPTRDSLNQLESTSNERVIAIKALNHYTNQESWISSLSKYEFDDDKQTFDKECDECKVKCYDPLPKDLLIYLHALSYKGTDWEYKSSMPVWAQQDWNYD